MSADSLTTVYFIRHAESDIRVRDDRSRPLTPKGLADSARLAEWFREISVDHIYTSPYLRAWQTVSDLASLKGLDVQPEESFRERKNCGYTPNFIDHIQWLWDDFNHCKAGEESMRQVQERCVLGLERLLVLHPSQTLVIGTHGTALSMVIQHYEPQFSVKDFWRIKEIMPWVIRAQFFGEDLSELKEVLVLE